MILDRIVASAKRRVEENMKRMPKEELRRQAFALQEAQEEGRRPVPASFEAALRRPGVSFICEVKKASPSKGLIAPVFPYVEIAKEYDRAGADAISVLTEPEFFLGSDAYLEEIHRATPLPLLRKDFTVDDYQIYEAKQMGASAVLLICALLDQRTLKEYIRLCRELGLAQLVEAHTDEEAARAAEAGASIIGINNRNLKTFEVDFSNALRLRRLVAPGTLFVAESGIKGPEDLRALAEARVDAVLIGETLMRAADRAAMLRALRSAAEEAAEQEAAEP